MTSRETVNQIKDELNEIITRRILGLCFRKGMTRAEATDTVYSDMKAKYPVQMAAFIALNS